MQLPFVLQSAETMKTAVAHLEPHMDRLEGQTSKGRLVLATVKGDVHDIGKNLVDIILTNNGYEVHNLGIKVAIADMIAKVREVHADAIGMGRRHDAPSSRRSIEIEGRRVSPCRPAGRPV
jgi:5-methyltetrahydrofolate--homocysteine methyltransferase